MPNAPRVSTRMQASNSRCGNHGGGGIMRHSPAAYVRTLRLRPARWQATGIGRAAAKSGGHGHLNPLPWRIAPTAAALLLASVGSTSRTSPVRTRMVICMDNTLVYTRYSVGGGASNSDNVALRISVAPCTSSCRNALYAARILRSSDSILIRWFSSRS